MLGTIEQMVAAAVLPHLDDTLPALVLSGTTQPPMAGEAPVLTVLAAALRCLPMATEPDAAPERGPAFQSRTLRVQPDPAAGPDGRVFTLPATDFDSATDRVEDVRTADGRALRLGEACRVDGAELFCLADPGGEVQVRVGGRMVDGYTERCRCEVDVNLGAWGPPAARWEEEVDTADRLLAAAVRATLDVFTEPVPCMLPGRDGFEMRLVLPRASLRSITRGAQPLGDASVMCAQATVVVRAELVTTLVSDAPEHAAFLIRQALVAEPRVEPARVAVPAGA